MVNLSTTYMGFKLKNPIIAGSSGLCNSINKIIEYESNGVGAVVLKSLFEEQIMADANKIIDYPEAYNTYPEAIDYIEQFTKSNSVEEYMKLIRDCKKEVKVPVFASINCVSMNEWISIAKDIENAGADALELNIFIMPYDINMSSANHEKMYFDIIEKIRKTIKIPLALKIGYYFSGLVNTIQKLSWTGIDALVMFNRFYAPDINLDNFKLFPSNIYSSPAELATSLRWIAMVSDRVKCDISASTGIHDTDAVIKQLLVGAKTTQLCSTLYINGAQRISQIIEELTQWMEHKNFSTIQDFRGKLSLDKATNPVMYHRAQYMKHLTGTE